MADHTKIEWTDATFNPWIGCTRVSTAASGGGGCDNCYAAVSTPARAMHIAWGAGEPRHRTADSTWAQPSRWNDQHAEFFAAHGRRRRVFCASLADVFDNEVDPTWRSDLFRLIAGTPNLDWQLLTKRIGNAKSMSQAAMNAIGCIHKTLPSNVWLGATVVNQEEADRDIPKLLATPARVRFLSMEPLLGPVDLHGLWSKQTGRKAIGGPIPPDYYSFINWVIAGGESGRGARPMHPDWARSLRDQCAAAGVPFMFKQWGAWAPGSCFPDEIPSGTSCDFDGTLPGDDERVWKVGKKAAGRLLDGVTHDGFPT